MDSSGTLDNSADSIESTHAPSKVAAVAARRPLDTSTQLRRSPNSSSINNSYVSAAVRHHFQPAILIAIFAMSAPQSACGFRRCRALYDCNADNDDELEFKEGEVLVVLNERTDDENWMEGEIESDSTRRGMFPVSFVHMLPD